MEPTGGTIFIILALMIGLAGGAIKLLVELIMKERKKFSHQEVEMMVNGECSKLRNEVALLENNMNVVRRERIILQRENNMLRGILYEMARVVRNTDALHPTTYGRRLGDLLLKVKRLDDKKYAELVLNERTDDCNRLNIMIEGEST